LKLFPNIFKYFINNRNYIPLRNIKIIEEILLKNFNSEWIEHPNLYEINTWPWLTELSEIYNQEIKLDNIPKEIYENYLTYFDAVWLMGVWERSPASKRIAQEDPSLQKEYHKALEHIKEDDIIGSPYAVYYYHVDKKLGGKRALTDFRENLKEHNIKLILDFVPNHVARDHMWTIEKSDLFVEGSFEDMNKKPNEFFSSYGRVLAHGKDPYFPPWTDTVQINVFSSEARKKEINTLKSIAEICDGVRCDMAMLVTNEVFKNTWGDKVGDIPEKEFWEEVIPPIIEKYPNFKFIAEVYWNMEWNLMQQGFDYCYDKNYYNMIIDKNIKDLKEYLHADFKYQKNLIRFIENHDENRVEKELGIRRSEVAAVLTLTLPGMGFIHEGQMKGYEIKIPVQLKRRRNEIIKNKMLEFYRSLLATISNNNVKNNNWELCNVNQISQEDHTNEKIISYHWWANQEHFIIIINFNEISSKGKIKIPSFNLDSERIKFRDLLTDEIFRYDTSELQNNGFYIEVPGLRYYLFHVES